MLRRFLSLTLAAAMTTPQALASAAQTNASKIEAARKAYWEGHFEASLGGLEALAPSLTAKTEIRDAQFLIGLNHLAFSRREEARASFRKASEADPSFVPSEELYPPDVVTLYRDVRGEHTEEPPEHKAASAGSGAPQRFEDVKLLLATGGETEENDAVLVLEGTKLLVQSKKEGALLKELAYRDIKAAQYSHSRHPRWKEGVGFAVAVGVFAAPIFFMKGKKHWLTLQTADDYALLRLDKNNYQIIILALETRAGVEVEVAGES